MKKFILPFVISLFLFVSFIAFAAEEKIYFNWIYDNPPVDLKAFQIFQQDAAGEWDLIIEIPPADRTTSKEIVLKPTSNVFGIWAVDEDDLHGNMKVVTLRVNPADIESFTIHIVYEVNSN
ncbi:MAG: hypothetical protein ACTSXY_09055 [Promethearchaeota archaeon]